MSLTYHFGCLYLGTKLIIIDSAIDDFLYTESEVIVVKRIHRLNSDKMEEAHGRRHCK